MTATPHALARETAAARPGHAFYVAVAWIVALLAFAGFARTFYLNAWFARYDLGTLRILHGVLFSAWVVLLVVQTTLVATRRTAVHRRVGAVGAVLAASMVVTGVVVALGAGRNGFQNPGLPPPQIFMLIPLVDIALFAGLTGAALALRDRPDWHKRLMLLATLAITPPIFARLPVDALRAMQPLAAFGLASLGVIAVAAWDTVARRRLHPAYLWGGLVVVLSMPLRVLAAGTATWQSIARWLVGA